MRADLLGSRGESTRSHGSKPRVGWTVPDTDEQRDWIMAFGNTHETVALDLVIACDKRSVCARERSDDLSAVVERRRKQSIPGMSLLRSLAMTATGEPTLHSSSVASACLTQAAVSPALCSRQFKPHRSPVALPPLYFSPMEKPHPRLRMGHELGRVHGADAGAVCDLSRHRRAGP